MTTETIYLDYMATSPVDPRVIEKMLDCLGKEGNFANPASVTHSVGKRAAVMVENARQTIANCLGASSEEIIFTSGATEANNLAILGAANFYHHKGRHVITMATEHKSVLESFYQLEQQGFTVTYLYPDSRGLLNLEKLIHALTPQTILVSIMHVNNEIGVIQDIEAIGALLKNKGIIFHVDAAQSGGKLPLNLSQEHKEVDLLSLSAHKIYGPKGSGLLYVRQRPRIRLKPQSFGGFQERGLRAGTLATHQIVGLAEALAIAVQVLAQEQAYLLTLRQQLWQGIQSLPQVQLHGDEHQRVAGNLNVYLPNLNQDNFALLTASLAVSTTSACLAATFQPSYVLSALGITQAMAYQSFRLSIGRFTTVEEVVKSIQVIHNFYKTINP